jgi:hypothetical protein
LKGTNVVCAWLLTLGAAAGLASAGPVTAAQAATAKTDKCSVHVNIAHPHAGQTETLTVTSTTGKTTVQVRIKYKTVSHTWNIKTPGSPAKPRAAYSFGVGRPTKGYKVTLNGKVTVAPKGYKAGATCAASFVPA